MKAHSMLLDALDHTKEGIRAHYDTYMSRVDSLLLFLTLIWPHALNTIQFSDDFLPGYLSDRECSVCSENHLDVVVWVWVLLIGAILVLPFWGILMLVRCKMKLKGWLERSLAAITRERRGIVDVRRGLLRKGQGPTDNLSKYSEYDTREMVEELVEVLGAYQEYLSRIWTTECGRLVRWATIMLWVSAVGAVLVTAISLSVFFTQKGVVYQWAAVYFVGFVALGVTLPAIYVVRQRWFRRQVTPPSHVNEEVVTSEHPLASPRVHREGSFAADDGAPRRSLSGHRFWSSADCCRRRETPSRKRD